MLNSQIERDEARRALAELPEGRSYGERPALEEVYLPSSHVKALDLNNLLVTGMRGSGKTFWWSALQEPEVRRLVGQFGDSSGLNEGTQVRIGFGMRPAIEEYPNKDILRQLLSQRVRPRTIWRAVQAWQLATDDHPLKHLSTWVERAGFVESKPEAVERLLQERDIEFHRQGTYHLFLFDALDRCADDWKDMYPAIRGLLQTALDLRSYRRLRVKVFLRSDQVNESEVADFPDASKVLASRVELNWPRNELYGLLWHYLANRRNGSKFQAFLRPGLWPSLEIAGKTMVKVPRPLEENRQREAFHAMAGQWMGRGPKRGFPYSWIPNHLADAAGRVSPRSFLDALRTSAENTANEHPEHPNALHFESIKRGVQEASRVRVSEIQEDYPWVHRILQPLKGMTVPCRFAEIVERWSDDKVLERLREDISQKDVKLPPLHIHQGEEGVREDLESLGVFKRMADGRVNVPDVFRVGYGLGRRGGVRPVR